MVVILMLLLHLFCPNALDAGDTVYDYFNYTLSDGTATDTATITITVTDVDDDITAVDDYDNVTEGYTRSRDADTSYDIDSDDTDPDDSSPIRTPCHPTK